MPVLISQTLSYLKKEISENFSHFSGLFYTDPTKPYLRISMIIKKREVYTT